MQAPVIAGADGKPLFYGSAMENYELVKAESLEGGVNRLNYKKRI